MYIINIIRYHKELSTAHIKHQILLKFNDTLFFCGKGWRARAFKARVDPKVALQAWGQGIDAVAPAPAAGTQRGGHCVLGGATSYVTFFS